MQPAGLPGRTTGRGAATTPYPSTRRGISLSPQHLDYRHAGTRVEDAFGARTNMGTCAQKGRVTRPVSHAPQTAPQTRNCRPKPYLTPVRSFRDEKRKVTGSIPSSEHQLPRLYARGSCYSSKTVENSGDHSLASQGVSGYLIVSGTGTISSLQ